MYELIPQELRSLEQWVGWKKVVDDKTGKVRKIPINPTSGYGAQSNVSTTWSTFEVAVRAVNQYGLDGIGIMFANGIFGIDIDHCIDAQGEIEPYALEIVQMVHSYIELSPSRTGIHILCCGTFPGGSDARCRTPIDSIYNVEMYSKTRFFTVTGEPYAITYPFADCTESAKIVYDTYIATKPAEAPAVKVVVTPHSNYCPMGVDDVLERAFNAKNGKKFHDLYDGNWQSYALGDGSQSSADQTFCNMLAFWCRQDAALMDAIFQHSGLMRPKWTSRRGGSTYGGQTIASAIDNCREVWEPPKPRQERRPPLPPPPPLIEQSDSPPPPPISDTPAANDPDKPHYYKYDDSGNAQRFRDENRGDIRYNYIDDHWMYWDGRRWAVDETDAIKRKADAMLTKMEGELYQTSDEMYNSFKKHISKSRSHRGKEAFIVETKHLEGVPLLPAELDRAGNAFNVKNCVISLKTGNTQEHDRKYLISKLADINYIKDAKCPYWNKFMTDITCGREDLKLYLQRMVGYALTASTREQCMFFLLGNGRNGKSTFVDTIAYMMGEYAARCDPDTVMLKDKNNGTRSDLARLKGARLVVTAEPNEGCRLDEGIVKQMTGGTDNKLVARFLYGKEFEFTPEFKIIMSTNCKPVIKGTDNGIWRRIRLIPFDAQISKDQEDSELPHKLRRELPGILNWAIEGSVGWYRDGFPPCPLIDAAVSSYRTEMDRTQQFVDDCLLTEEGSTIQSAKLYHVYKGWCTEQGDRYPMTSVKFSIELKKRFQSHKTSAFNEYVGINFNDHGYSLSMLAVKE